MPTDPHELVIASAPTTGLSSTSAKFASAGGLSGILVLAQAILENRNGITTDIQMIIGGLVTLFSIVAKLYHDVRIRGFHQETVRHAITEGKSVIETTIAPAVEEGIADTQAVLKE